MEIKDSSPYFKKWGNGKQVLIFLHYFGGDMHCWKWVAKKLANKFTCIAINLPGAGGTPCLAHQSIGNYSFFIEALLNQLNIHEYSIIGHSMGGKIAMKVTMDDVNNKVKQLILVAPSPPENEDILPADKLPMLNTPTTNEAAKIIYKLIKRPLANKQFATAINAQINTAKGQRDWWVNAGCQESILRGISKITCPVTILFSEDDPAITCQTIEHKVLPCFTGATSIAIKNIGHLYPFEAVGWLAETIMKVIDRNTE